MCYKRKFISVVIGLLAVAFIFGGGVSTRAATSELFFSEYIEGSSNNKALEIYNNTGATIDLTANNYNVQMYFNGNSSAGLTINLTGTVADGDVFVLAQSSADSTILAQADQTNGSGWFNGDDAVVLRKGSEIIDVIGQIGTDPGSEWGSGLTSTADNTLRRKADICAGDTDGSNAFDPSVEWNGFAQNTFDGLGSHTANCGGTTTPGQPLPLTENFDDCTLAGWQIVSVDADAAHTWACSASFSNIEVNGFGDTAPANDWLITPALNLDAQAGDTLTFRSHTSFTDINYPQVHVLYSTDYDGGGDPTTATWMELTGITFSAENSSVWTDSGDVDLSGISGTNVYIAFQYVSSGTGAGTAARWRLDAINLFEQQQTVTTKVHEVQGNGSASPLVGQTVTIEGIVVGDFQDGASGTNGDLNGFFVQEEDADADSDPLTSEGIFVFDGNSPAVNVANGDLVRVEGAVSEFNGLTEITSFSGVTVVSNSNPLPTKTNLSLPITSVDDFEAYEGMLVTFPQALVISEYFNFDRFGEIVLTSERHTTPTAEVEPGSAAIQAAQDFLLDKITLDDGRSSQNPDPAIHPNGNIFDLNNLFRGGDTVANVTGVMHYAFDLYRIQPTQGADYTNANPRPTSPESVGGSLKVASFNVLNYFTTLDNSGPICGPLANQDCRGADDATEFTRQRDKIIAALTEIDADVVGLLEIENYPGDVPTADLVSGLSGYDYIETGAIGSDAIRVALIYKPASVTPVGPYAILDSSVDARFIDTKNRPALAQTFIDNSTGGKFTVAVNHLKSKGSACDDVGDPDTGDGAGNCNLTRKAAAEALVDWLAGDPTGSEDEDFLIIGDLNSYDKEDPIDAILAGGYTDLARYYQGEYAYSYVFDGQTGYLDYALSSAGLQLDSEVTGATEWHINADEPDLIDYDTSFKQAAQDAIYAPDAYRASDHDPVIVGLNVCDEIAPTLEVSVSPDSLWPANHKYVTVTATPAASDNFDSAPVVTLVSVTSSEADSGLGDGDKPNDIVIINDTTFDLRAERSGNGDGRTYTITYQVTDSCGNSTQANATVTVPHDQGKDKDKGKNQDQDQGKGKGKDPDKDKDKTNDESEPEAPDEGDAEPEPQETPDANPGNSESNNNEDEEGVDDDSGAEESDTPAESPEGGEVESTPDEASEGE